MSAPASGAAKRPAVLTAGGTGGHMFPALALAEELARRGRRVVVFTDARGQNYAEKIAGIESIVVPSASPSRGGPLGRIGFLATLARGAWAASRLLRKLRAEIVVGFGGYASFPAGFMAARHRLPLILHEQNGYLGLANRKLATKAAAIGIAFPKVVGIPQTSAEIAQVGNPVRPAFLDIREQPYAAPANGAPFRLMVMGGSQGARVFSEVIPEALGKLDRDLRSRLDVAQQCRPEDLAAVQAAYATIGVKATLKSFFDDVPARLGAAQLLIVRAGASTVAEITVAGRPAIYVPYPHAADDHQRYNAEAVAAAGAGWAIAQPQFTADALAARLVELAHRPQELGRAAAAARAFGRPDAANALADLVEKHWRPRTA
ncbi:MAG: undecaprenyldiphospho-muramoylpentapeptide beta-N-acetylglucosaminyltransferase [Candidatus Odyssella sp.]|nr:undecaprenyldiphospho-muramoylpentapeptide beta-N-acetylglucosaminyltransferase [Candidatus Odyssella sp.]